MTGRLGVDRWFMSCLLFHEFHTCDDAAHLAHLAYRSLICIVTFFINEAWKYYYGNAVLRVAVSVLYTRVTIPILISTSDRNQYDA